MPYVLTVVGLIVAAAIGLFVRGSRERKPPESMDIELQRERIRMFPRTWW